MALPATAQEWYDSYLFSEKTALQNDIEIHMQQESPQIEPDKSTDKKSVFSAFLLSLALPGLGEAYVGEFQYTRFFLATEILGWGLYVSLSNSSRMRAQCSRQ